MRLVNAYDPADGPDLGDPDIHANLPALEAALARIEELGADAVYWGGDLVG